MKKIYYYIIGIIVVLLISISYLWITFDISNLIQSINNCNHDSDCIIVSRGFCGGALSINKNYLSFWNYHLEQERKLSGDVVCKPTLPLEYFEAKCNNGKCTELQIKSG